MVVLTIDREPLCYGCFLSKPSERFNGMLMKTRIGEINTQLNCIDFYTNKYVRTAICVYTGNFAIIFSNCQNLNIYLNCNNFIRNTYFWI